MINKIVFTTKNTKIAAKRDKTRVNVMQFIKTIELEIIMNIN